MQGEYVTPDEIMQRHRVAWNDKTLKAKTLPVVQSRDGKWKENYGPEPREVIDDAFDHNHFYIYPKPTTGTPETYTFNSDYGILVRYYDADGNAYAIIPDDFGVIVRMDDIQITGDYGDPHIVSNISETYELTIWGDARPATMSADSDEIPIRRPWQIAIFFFVLWQIYDGEGDQHNGPLAAHYRDRFGDQIQRAQIRMVDAAPAQVNALRGDVDAVGSPADETQFGDVVIGGIPIPTIWPPGR